MTPVALYQSFARVALFLLGIGSIWIAVFLVLIWLLHYEPVRIKRWPDSRRERIAWIMIATAFGVFAMAFAPNMVFAHSITTAMALNGCVGALVLLTYLAFVWTSTR